MDSAHKKIERDCVAGTTRRRGSCSLRSCKGACLDHDVCLLVVSRVTVEVETPRHQQKAFPRNSPETHIWILPEKNRQEYGEDKVDRLIKSMYATQDASHIWQLDNVNMICGEPGRIPEMQTQCSIVPQSKRRSVDGSAP